MEKLNMLSLPLSEPNSAPSEEPFSSSSTTISSSVSPNFPRGEREEEEEEERRNWRELPQDVLVTILMKLEPLHVLESTQFVCKSWYEACKDPAAWRTINIDFERLEDRVMQSSYDKMVIHAVDRSCGGLLEFGIEDFCSDQLLLHIAHRSSSLKCLRLRCCYVVSNKVMLEVVQKLPLLEEIELTICPVTDKLIRSIGENCPNLVSLKLNQTGSKDPNLADDEHAVAIAETMPQLRHLQLIGNMMTNDGLQAILNSCTCLESLDLRACFLVDISGSMGTQCADKVKDIKWPYDSTSDYKFITMDYDSDYQDDDELLFDFNDYMSGDEYYEFSDDSELPDYEDLFL